jgi:hypothetical protein
VAILPSTPLPKKGNRCNHLGQHHDTYIIYMFYNTASKYINIVTSKQHTITQSIVRKLLLKDYHKGYNFLSRNCRNESSITSCYRIFNSFCYGNQSIWNTNLQGQPNKLKHNPNHFAHFSLAPNNLITLTLHDN